MSGRTQTHRSGPAPRLNTFVSGAQNRARRTGTKSWRKAKFTLKGAKFGNGQNRGADFRLVVEAPEFGVGKVALTR